MKHWTSRDTYYLTIVIFLSCCLMLSYVWPRLSKESMRPAMPDDFRDSEMILQDDDVAYPAREDDRMREAVTTKEIQQEVVRRTPSEIFANESGMTREEIAANLGIRPEDLPPQFQRKTESD